MRRASENEFPELNRLLERIRDTYDPLAVFLIGSRARGEAAETSDWDFHVILPDTANEELLSLEFAWTTVKGTGINADIMPTFLRDFLGDLDVVNTLAQETRRDGVLLHGDPAFIDASEIVQGDLAQTETDRLMIQIYREHAEIGDYDPAEDERLAAEGPWLHLTYRTGANQVRAARILKDHGIPLKFAHIALTEMIDTGSAKLADSGIQDSEKLMQELEEVGIFAERLDVE
ncbi:putative nucleotidyltransferases [Roseibium aggregatum]|jgi:predicted nucleotidyltransferase|uniref:Putative nucleotidyltransferases n=1 Tax=Roseibium aggregatum TaxID=187304 RepID=A0A0M6YCG3_9HYPH|nr:putative nucleotidyltransferases [Roseibium aggregatum]